MSWVNDWLEVAGKKEKRQGWWKGQVGLFLNVCVVAFAYFISSRKLPPDYSQLIGSAPLDDLLWFHSTALQLCTSIYWAFLWFEYSKAFSEICGIWMKIWRQRVNGQGLGDSRLGVAPISFYRCTPHPLRAQPTRNPPRTAPSSASTSSPARVSHLKYSPPPLKFKLGCGPSSPH